MLGGGAKPIGGGGGALAPPAPMVATALLYTLFYEGPYYLGNVAPVGENGSPFIWPPPDGPGK